jgi:hypothetical protein
MSSKDSKFLFFLEVGSAGSLTFPSQRIKLFRKLFHFSWYSVDFLKMLFDGRLGTLSPHVKC